MEGFYIVAGFSGHGFMHGPVAGKCMSEIILEGKATTVDVSMLDLARFKESRDSGAVNTSLDKLSETAGTTANIMPSVLAAVEAHATVGEIANRLRGVFSSYREQVVW